MENLKIVKYSSDKKKEWDAFVSNSKNGTFLFQRDFMDYHADRFIDYSLMVYEGNKLLGVFPSNINDGVVYSHQGLSYGGLILSFNEKYQKIILIFKFILDYLYQQNIKTIEIKEIPSIYHIFPSDEVQHILFVLKAKLLRRDCLSILCLENNLKYTKDRKEGVKRGMKNSLIVKEVDDFKEFWSDILIPNLKLKHAVAPVHSLEEITFLKQKFPKKIRQFNVYKNNCIVGGTTIFESKKVAHSQYISGNSKKNELGSLDFLHDELIKNVFKNKNYFDFGISNEDNGTKVNSGLQYWKEGFGARTITQGFYRITTKNYKLLNDVLK